MDYLAAFALHPAALALAAAICAAVALVLLATGRKNRTPDVFALLEATKQPATGGAERQPPSLQARISPRLRRRLTAFATPFLGALGGVGFVGFLWLVSPYAPRALMEVRPATCAQARALGYGSARIGSPGYFAHLDADKDGISCEPWTR